MNFSLKLFLLAGVAILLIFVFTNKKKEIPIELVTYPAVDEIEEVQKKIYPETPPIIDGVILGEQKILVEVMVMLDEITRGLSGRESLPQDKGMLFIFESMEEFSPAPDFWMRNMKFPIDMIWIGRDHKVVYIKKNARPESYPTTFGPGAKIDARYVLEVNSGFSDKYYIKVGDPVVFFGHDFPPMQ